MSVRALQTSTVFQRSDGLSSSSSSSSSSSRQGNNWAAAAAAGAAALLGSGAMVSLCEGQVPNVAIDEDKMLEPEVIKNIKDPMTIYAIQAIRRASEDQARVAGAQENAKESKRPAPAPAPTNTPEPKLETMAEKNSPAPQATLQATSKTIRRVTDSQEEEEEDEQQEVRATSAVDTSLAPAQPFARMTEDELRIEEKTRKAKQHSGGIKIFSGNGNMSLAMEIAQNLGINLGKATVGRFADGECNVVIHENVRGKDVYVIQPTCTPVNDNLMELLLMVSTLRRASARRITVVIPYYGYARQDRKMQVRFVAHFFILF